MRQVSCECVCMHLCVRVRANVFNMYIPHHALWVFPAWCQCFPHSSLVHVVPFQTTVSLFSMCAWVRWLFSVMSRLCALIVDAWPFALCTDCCLQSAWHPTPSFLFVACVWWTFLVLSSLCVGCACHWYRIMSCCLAVMPCKVTISFWVRTKTFRCSLYVFS